MYQDEKRDARETRETTRRWLLAFKWNWEEGRKEGNAPFQPRHERHDDVQRASRNALCVTSGVTAARETLNTMLVELVRYSPTSLKGSDGYAIGRKVFKPYRRPSKL